MNRRQMLKGIVPIAVAATIPAAVTERVTRPLTIDVRGAKEVKSTFAEMRGQIEYLEGALSIACADETKLMRLSARIQSVRDVTEVQCSPGNVDYDEYMRGMANGLICAMALLDSEDPEYVDPPDTYLAHGGLMHP